MKTEKRCCVFKDNCLKIIFFLVFHCKRVYKKDDNLCFHQEYSMERDNNWLHCNN